MACSYAGIGVIARGGHKILLKEIINDTKSQGTSLRDYLNNSAVWH